MEPNLQEAWQVYLKGSIKGEEDLYKKAKTDEIIEILCSEKAGLSPRDRKIMRYFYLEGRPIKEIGKEMDLTKAHIGVILMRTRNRIARELGSYKD